MHGCKTVHGLRDHFIMIRFHAKLALAEIISLPRGFVNSISPLHVIANYMGGVLS